jgi:hypothetical protein
MTVKEGTPAAKRIQRESDARQKVIEAMTDEQHKKTLDHLAQVQMMNRIEAGKTKVADLVKRHGAIPVKTMSH